MAIWGVHLSVLSWICAIEVEIVRATDCSPTLKSQYTISTSELQFLLRILGPNKQGLNRHWDSCLVQAGSGRDISANAAHAKSVLCRFFSNSFLLITLERLGSSSASLDTALSSVAVLCMLEWGFKSCVEQPQAQLINRLLLCSTCAVLCLEL